MGAPPQASGSCALAEEAAVAQPAFAAAQVAEMAQGVPSLPIVGAPHSTLLERDVRVREPTQQRHARDEEGRTDTLKPDRGLRRKASFGASGCQTAVGFPSTPKIERVRTSRPTSAIGRASPSRVANDGTRSKACTRKAPEPHAGSSTRRATSRRRRASASVAPIGSPASAGPMASSAAPGPRSASRSASVVTSSTTDCGVKKAPLSRRRRDAIRG